MSGTPFRHLHHLVTVPVRVDGFAVDYADAVTLDVPGRLVFT